MPPLIPVPLAGSSGRRGFTLLGALSSVALLAAAVAVCAPLVAKRLRTHAAVADDAARRVESAVVRGLGSVGALADAYPGTAVAPLRSDTGWTPVAAGVPDEPMAAPSYPETVWSVPENSLVLPLWPRPPLFWRPYFARPGPWSFNRRPSWRAGSGRRR